MAWATPSTFTVGEVVTASKMNEIRDNLRYLKGLDGEVSLDNHLRLNNASYELRLGTAADAVIRRDGSATVRTNAALKVDAGVYVNGGAISVLEPFVVAQANNKQFMVSAEGITGTTAIASGAVRHVTGQAWAYGSSSGMQWGANPAGVFAGAVTGGTVTLVTFTGGLVLELSGGTLQFRRTSGSETWAGGVIAQMR